MREKVYCIICGLFFFCVLISGCGDSGKESSVKAPEPVKSGVQQASPAGTAKGTPMSCYEVGLRTGRCAAKGMSGLPCEPADEIPIPPECKETADMKRGLADGRKSVY